MALINHGAAVNGPIIFPEILGLLVLVQGNSLLVVSGSLLVNSLIGKAEKGPSTIGLKYQKSAFPRKLTLKVSELYDLPALP